MNQRKNRHIGFKGHRKLEKYNEFIGQENIIYKKGELCWVENKQGWLALDGTIIKDKNQALEYAMQLDRLYRTNKIRKCRF